MDPELYDPNKAQARRIRVGDRIVVLPPDGHGEKWNGSAR